MISGIPDPERIGDPSKDVTEAEKEKAQINLFINNRADGNGLRLPRISSLSRQKKSSR